MGRVIVLSLLIIVLAVGGLVWFDYLNVIDVKTTLAPVYRRLGLEGRSRPAVSPDEDILNLDAERLTIRLEALELQRREMDSRDQQLQDRYGEIEQMAQEVEERQKAQDERENSFNASVQEAETKDRNVEQISRYLNGMNPAQAVAIITAMDDQDIIDVFRKTEEIAQAAGTASIVSVWLSQIPDPARAAELQRKMINRPPNLN
ncbi:flagellar protein FlbB [Spirochaetia bacterium]|nr:flagellar protein FlbB [Spirochaetia bacterium]